MDKKLKTVMESLENLMDANAGSPECWRESKLSSEQADLHA